MRALATDPSVARPPRNAGSAPALAPVASAPAARPARTAPVSEAWNRYLAALPEPSRRFLELLEQRGQITVDEAVSLLGLPGPKAMGGLTGAMRRWAPKKGVELPFMAITDNQRRRAWVWTGIRA
ncbi:MAG: hypothetical protein H6706_09130 [Myxococcales bacterium]|nr:hypothetical protein [Myxococcales bacterium]